MWQLVTWCLFLEFGQERCICMFRLGGHGVGGSDRV
jgi:hypothetical protein